MIKTCLNLFICEIISVLKYLFVTLLFVFAYIYLSRLWTPIGGGSSQLFAIEIKIIILILLLFYFPQIKNKTIKYIFPVFIIFLPYLLFDIFYNFLGRSPRMSDFQNYTALSDFSFFLYAGLALFVFSIFFIPFTLFYSAYKELSARRKIIDLAVRIILFVILVFGIQSNYFIKKITNNFEEIEWSQQRTINKNGRIASFIYFFIEENNNLKLLSKYKGRQVDFYKELFPGNISIKRNVYIVVLESFIDPRNIEGVQNFVSVI